MYITWNVQYGVDKHKIYILAFMKFTNMEFILCNVHVMPMVSKQLPTRTIPHCTIGAFPHTKKARFVSRFKSRLFLRVSTQAEKSAIWIATIFYACPHRQKNRDPNRTGSSDANFLIKHTTHADRKNGAPRPCMMGYKKPVRFSVTVLTHFAQKIVAIIFK